MYKALITGFLAAYSISLICATSVRADDFLPNHYSVAKEIKLYTDLDISLHTEDLRSYLLKGSKASIMVRFDIQREKYEDLVTINKEKLGTLQSVSPDVFRSRLAEYRCELPDRGWFWELLGYDGPFWAGKSSVPGICDTFAVSIGPEVLRVVLVCDRVNDVSLSEQVMLYAGLELPAGAKNINFEILQQDTLHDLSKDVFLRFDLGDYQSDEIAGISLKSKPGIVKYVYDQILPKDYFPAWWQVEPSERYDVEHGEKITGSLSTVPGGRAYVIPIRSGGRRFYQHVSHYMRQKNERERIEEIMGKCFPGEIQNLTTDFFSSPDGDFNIKARFETTQKCMAEMLNQSPRIFFQYAGLKEDRETLENACKIGYTDPAMKVKFWQEQLGLSDVICAMGSERCRQETEVRTGNRQYYICLKQLDTDNVRVYVMYYGAVRH